MKIPIVSIVMPAYNSSRYIGRAISSVISQSLDSWELIIVDDNSTDDSLSIIEGYSEQDNRVKFIHNSVNMGAAESRNIALCQTKGRYIAFLDSDDYWHPEKLSIQINFMLGKKIDFSFSSYTRVSVEKKIINIVQAPQRVSYADIIKHNHIGFLTVIYDTQKYGKFFMPSIRKRQDFALILNILKKFDYAYGVDESLAFYTVRRDSLSSNLFEAIKYYWIVLRKIEAISFFKSLYCTFNHIIFAIIKRKSRARSSKSW